MTDKELASNVLRKYEDDNEYHLHQVDRVWIIEAMIEFSKKSNMNNISSSGIISGTLGLYSTPELIDVIVTPTEIHHVYKRQLMMSNGFGMPKPEVYKVIYSRNDGSEKVLFGEYLPATNESYNFE